MMDSEKIFYHYSMSCQKLIKTFLIASKLLQSYWNSDESIEA